MPTSSFRVAATFLRKSADDDAAERDLALREQEEDKVISPGLFVDLMGFFVALGAYQKMRGEGDEHLVGVRGLLTRYQDELVAGLQRFFVPLAEDPLFARFKSRLHLAARPSRGLAQAALQVEVISDVLQALHSKPNLLREVLPDNRAYLAAVKLANLLVNEAPETVLNGLATIPPASRLTVTRKWVREAAERAGVAPSDTESTIADAAAAHDIGEDIHRVEVDLASADQVSPAAAALQDRKRDLLGQVDAVASTSPNPSVVVAAVASTAAKPADYATTIGRKQGLSPEQEQAMLIRGKGIIAAGAGSGKTRVLSSKVAYHVNELGLPVSAVLATSFSKKSAAELRQKIEKCGVDIPNAADTGFGTTHKIAAAIRTEYGGGTGEYLKPYETSSAIRIAMAQVQMTSPNAGKPPPPTSLFAGLLPAGGGTPPDPAEDAPPSPADLTGLSFREACELAFKQRNRLGNSFLTSFIADLFNQSSLWYGKNMRATQDLKNPRGFSEKQQDIIIDIFNRLRIPYDPDTDPVLNGTRKTAAKDKNKSLRDRYPTFTRPVNQWFNLGLKLEEEGPGGVKKPIPPGTFARAITKWKGRAVSPSEAWAEGQSAEAAVYAAYEFLKGPNGETDFVNKGDFDDGLLDASKMLLSNPRALAQVQSRFKLVLVDEAQDLNRAQHLLFGLVAGYVDPAKAHEIGKAKKMSQVAKHDNSISADTYCFIGDDKQAIYEFRSADPEAFIDMSDLVEGGAGFTTKVLKTNYRSGKNIVEAANRLVSFNKKQIPMVCNANPARANTGGIERIPFDPVSGSDMDAPAEWLAERIAEDHEQGLAGPHGYDSYGVGLRSNAEAYTYGLALLEKGIPFRSKANFFKDPSAKALICWLTIADEGIDGDVDRINEAVLGARGAPATMLGDKFVEKVEAKATGNYLKWLETDWGQVYGTYGDWSSKVKGYTDNLLKVAAMKGKSSDETLTEVLSLTGFDGQSMLDALVTKIEGDEDRLEELRKESPDGKVSPEALAEAALAPVKPLKKLISTRANLAEAMKYVRKLRQANESLATDDDPDAKGFKEPAVTLGTMHSWKGLEVSTMFVPVVGGRFPRRDSDEDALASERRLAYVALTRGENQVYVLDIPTITPGRKGVPPQITHSQFLDEMCIPTRGAKPSGDPDKMARVAGASPWDEDEMDAYLRGERP